MAKNDFFVFLILSLILAALTGDMGPEYDGGLYHLPHQLWLRSESIVVGLAKLHGRFGFGSLYEYIAAPLWIKEQFILLSYLQVAFVVFFLLFIFEQANISRGTHLVLLFGVTVNITIFYGYIKVAYTYTDLPAGFIFAATVFVLLFPVLFMFFHGKTLKQHENIWKLLQFVVIIGVVIFACRFGNPWSRITFNNALTIKTLSVGKPQVRADAVYGVRPIQGDQCWLVPECSPFKRPQKSSWHGISVFYSN